MIFYIGLVSIVISVILITDCTDWSLTMKRLLSGLLTKGMLISDKYRFHLFDCSLCQITWLGLIWLLVYSLVFQTFNPLHIPLILLCGYMSEVFKSIFFLLKDILIYIINKIERLLV